MVYMRKTKIICTLGPSTDDREVLRQLCQNGMDVARLNFSHQNHETHLKRLQTLMEVRKEMNLPIASLADTRGPEIRIGKMNNDVVLKKGQRFDLDYNMAVPGDVSRAAVTYEGLSDDIMPGNRILLDDGRIELRVDDVSNAKISCYIIDGGPLSSSKGINIPGVKLSLPFISSADRSDLRFIAQNKFDFVAASFTCSADDIIRIREELSRLGSPETMVIAKIENAEGVRNIDEILSVSDGIMVARGDMGVEVPLEDVPVIQKVIIKKAYNAGKVVITATQMLESMIQNPRPTRAETNDVANAIYDGTSAIMLSGETAAGEHPVEAVKTMASIASRIECDIDYKKRFLKRDVDDNNTVTNAISHATCTTAHDLGAEAIITVSKTGRTARMISKYRPYCRIVGCTTSEIVCRQLNLSWGVTPAMMGEQTSTDELFAQSVITTEKSGIIKDGDLVVITAGVPVGMSGTTNILKVHVVGDML